MELALSGLGICGASSRAPLGYHARSYGAVVAEHFIGDVTRTITRDEAEEALASQWRQQGG